MIGSVVARVVVRPWLWVTALRQTVRVWPFGREYVRFRMQTMYGSAPLAEIAPTIAADTCSYLEWCRRMNRLDRQHRTHPNRSQQHRAPTSQR
jgi:hypothetical protein